LVFESKRAALSHKLWGN